MKCGPTPVGYKKGDENLSCSLNVYYVSTVRRYRSVLYIQLHLYTQYLLNGGKVTLERCFRGNGEKHLRHLEKSHKMSVV